VAAVFFSSRVYGNRAIFRVEKLVGEFLKDEDFRTCMEVFATVNSTLSEEKALDVKAIFRTYRKSGLSIDDAALSFLDGTITTLKKLAARRPSPESDRAISLMESVVDGVMFKRPGRILPRNGRFAKAAEAAGLAAFLKEQTE
jgi:hypothetical protein